MSVLIVIVNYRSPMLVIECLRSLQGEIAALRDARAVVVDNNSGDDSCSRIEQAIEVEGWRDWAALMPLDTNDGFASGNNAAIRAALASASPPQLIGLLNPDTVVRPGAIVNLVRFLDDHPRAGIAGAVLEGENGERDNSARRCPSPVGELISAAGTGAIERSLERWNVSMPISGQPQQCDWVSGAGMMVRREVFETIGLLDEGFFLYFEEVDFCERARRAGWECWSVPQAQIMHYEGAITGVRDVQARCAPHWVASRRRFFIKRYGVLGLIVADAMWVMGRAINMLRPMIGRSTNPAGLGLDILFGDVRAAISGEVSRIAREARRT